MAAVAPPDDFEPVNPYKGLRAFQTLDAQDFFGREKVIAKLVERLSETGAFSHFLAVVGPSGSGKSSLVQAGLMPALARGALPGSERWQVVEMVPSAHPLEELAAALSPADTDLAESLRQLLAEDLNGLERAARQLWPAEGSQLLLVVDQFEECFTVLDDEAIRLHFFDLLRAAVTEPSAGVRVIITLRADFYDRPLHFPQLGELISHRAETITALSADELEAAIVKPAQRVGMRFEPGLISAMIADVNNQPGALPLLQYALTELFEHRRGDLLSREAYEAIGRAGGALAKRADEVSASLDPGQQQVARQIFLRLVTIGENSSDLRRRAPYAELIETAGDGRAAAVVERFTAYRLLTRDTDPQTRAPTVEVAHEALLREWTRLRYWLDESREDIRRLRELEGMAAAWQSANHEISYLARGARLDIYTAWMADTHLVLTATECAYLEASIAEHDRQVSAEQSQQARALLLERRSRLFLRGLVAVLLIGLLGALALTAVAMNQQQIAVANAAVAVANADYARSVALASGVDAALKSNNPDQALALAMGAASGADSLPAINQRALYKAAFAPGTQRLVVDVSPAGGWLRPDKQRMLTWADSHFDYTDLASGQVLHRWTAKTLNGNTMPSVVILDDATAYGLMGNDGQTTGVVVEFNPTTGEETRHSPLVDGGDAFAPAVGLLSPDGKTLFVGAFKLGQIYQWDRATRQIIRHFDPLLFDESLDVLSLAFSADGQQLLAGYGSGAIALWNVADGKLLRQYQGVGGEITNVFFSAGGIAALAGDWDKFTATASLLDPVTGAILHQQTWDGGPGVAALSQDGRTLAVGATSPAIKLVDMQTFAVTQLYGHRRTIYALNFIDHDQTLISTSADETLRFWSLRNGAELWRTDTLSNFLSGLVVNPDGKTVLAQVYNGPLELRDLSRGQVVRTLGNTENYFRSTAFSPDGRTLAVGSGTGQGSCPTEGSTLTLVDTQTGAQLWQAQNATGYFNSGLAFIAHGSQILHVDWQCDDAIKVWDSVTGQQAGVWAGHTGPIWAVATSPDDRFVATGAQDRSAILWNAATGKPIYTLPHEANVESVAFSPDSHILLTVAQTGVIRLWDTATGQKIRELTGHTSTSVMVQFSPDGRYIISSGVDNNIFVWDWQLGEIIREFNLPLVSPLGSAVAFAPDSQSILMTDENNVLHRVDLMLQPGELLDWVRHNRYVPDLTCEQRALYRLEPLCA